MQREIELINNIIANAIIHGGDWGGPYDSNLENLVTAVNNWLREKGLKDSYHVVQADYQQTLTHTFKYLPNEIEDGSNKTGRFTVLKIVPKSDNTLSSKSVYGDLDLIP